MRNSGPKEMEDVNYTSDPRQGHPHMARLACEAERWQARGQSSSTSMLRENGPRTLDTHPSVPDRQSREAWHTLKTFYRTRELTGPADGVPPERETYTAPHTKQGQLTQALTFSDQPVHSRAFFGCNTYTRHTHKHINQSSTQSYVLTPGSACSSLS